MKKYISFALIVCLFVLAAALVYSITRPDLNGGLSAAAEGAWDSAATFGGRVINALRDFIKG